MIGKLITVVAASVMRKVLVEVAAFVVTKLNVISAAAATGFAELYVTIKDYLLPAATLRRFPPTAPRSLSKLPAPGRWSQPPP